MRILMLAEGDPETRDSWSESSRSLLLALRALGHTVNGRDVTESPLARWAALTTSWAPRRRRWAARYHFGKTGFQARSARAIAHLTTLQPPPDVALQIGATFDATANTATPIFVYCDANVRTASQGGPYADVNHLTSKEIEAMASRESSVYRRATMIFTMSEYLRQSFIHDFGIAPDCVRTVYAGANLDLTRVVPRSEVPEGPPTILFVGRQWDRKGGPILLEAFREARRTLPSIRFRIAGCAPELAGEPGVEVLGPIQKDVSGGEDRLASLYRSADLFCMPSRFEPFGIVFVEAMLHGLPCIGTDRFAIPEIIVDGETGWVVPPDDPTTLAHRILAGLDNREGLITMGQRGRSRALQHFTWNRVAADIAASMEAQVTSRPPAR